MTKSWLLLAEIHTWFTWILRSHMILFSKSISFSYLRHEWSLIGALASPPKSVHASRVHWLWWWMPLLPAITRKVNSFLDASSAAVIHGPFRSDLPGSVARVPAWETPVSGTDGTENWMQLFVSEVALNMSRRATATNAYELRLMAPRIQSQCDFHSTVTEVKPVQTAVGKFCNRFISRDKQLQSVRRNFKGSLGLLNTLIITIGVLRGFFHMSDRGQACQMLRRLNLLTGSLSCAHFM